MITVIAEVTQAKWLHGRKAICGEKKDYSESTYIEEQNSQNEPDYKIAGLTSNGRLKGFLESKNVVNLYNGKLSRAEISLLSVGLKFSPTPNSVDKWDVKEDLEKFGRFLRLKWRYGNDKQTFDPNSFRPKSKFHPSNSDAAIELYLSQTKEKLLSCTQIKLTYYKLIREEQQSLSYLKNGWSIVIKKADNGSAMVTWG